MTKIKYQALEKILILRLIAYTKNVTIIIIITFNLHF